MLASVTFNPKKQEISDGVLNAPPSTDARLLERMTNS